MAKGDHERAETSIKTQTPIMQNSQDKMMGTLNNSQQQFQKTYDTSVGQNQGSYDQIMGQYNSLYNNPFGEGYGTTGNVGGGGGGSPVSGQAQGIYSDLANNGGGYGWDGGFRGAVDKAIGGFGSLADNGAGAKWNPEYQGSISNALSGYGKLAQDGGGYGWDSGMRGRMDESLAGYSDFAKTGGFSDQNLQDMRARAIAPTRGIYAQAQNELNRGRSLGGGSPNFAAAQARMAREQGSTIADANTNVNASIAEQVQRGRLAGLSGLGQTSAMGQGLDTDINRMNQQGIIAGLGGLSNTALGAQGMNNDIDALNLQGRLGGLQGLSQTGIGAQGVSNNINELNARMRLAGLSGLDAGASASYGAGQSADALARQNAQDIYKAKMGTLGGMTDLYGTVPGMMQTAGNQLLGSNQQLLGGQELQNQIGMGNIGATSNLANIPGNFQSAMNNVNAAISPIANVAGAFTGGFGGLGGNAPQNQMSRNITSTPNPWQYGMPQTQGYA